MSTIATVPELATEARAKAEAWERVQAALETLENDDLALLRELVAPLPPIGRYALGQPVPGLVEELDGLEAQIDSDRGDREDREPSPEATPADEAPPTEPPASPPSSPSRDGDLSETEAAYLAAVKDAPGLSGTAYGRKLGKTQGHASTNLRRLVSKGRIREAKAGSGKAYFPTDPQGAAAKDRPKKPNPGPSQRKAKKAEDEAVPRGKVERLIVAAMRRGIETEDERGATIGEIEGAMGLRDLGVVVGGLKRRGCIERVEGIPGIPLFVLAPHLAEAGS